LATIVAGMAVLFAGSCAPYHVTITGTIAPFRPRDTVFVTLTHTWDNITAPPKSFVVDSSGRYQLEFELRVLHPPITFVKNGSRYAKLTFHDLREISPLLYEEDRRRTYDVRVNREKRTLGATVDF
jgi:hypothetical protein